MAQHIPVHPARGIHGLMQGWVELPSLTNPVTYVAPGGSIGLDASGSLIPTFGLGRKAPHLGAFIAASFPVPQNPVRDALNKGMSGLGCGCGGSCSCGGGMGQLNFDMSSIMAGTAGWETYAVLGGGVLALMWAFGGRKKYAQSRQARAGRKAKLAAASEKYYEVLGS